MMYSSKSWLLATVAVVALLALGSSAQATFTLTLEDLNTGATATFAGDGGASTPGTITVGNFQVNVMASSINPINHDHAAQISQSTDATYTGTGEDTLEVTIQDDSLNAYPAGYTNQLFNGIYSAILSTGVTATSRSYYTDKGGTTEPSAVTVIGPADQSGEPVSFTD